MQGRELLLNLGKNKVNIRGSKLTAGLCGKERDPPSGDPAAAKDRRAIPWLTSEACALSASQSCCSGQAHDTSKGALPIMGSPDLG